jgi:hypothetical protein
MLCLLYPQCCSIKGRILRYSSHAYWRSKRACEGLCSGPLTANVQMNVSCELIHMRHISKRTRLSYCLVCNTCAYLRHLSLIHDAPCLQLLWSVLYPRNRCIVSVVQRYLCERAFIQGVEVSIHMPTAVPALAWRACHGTPYR